MQLFYSDQHPSHHYQNPLDVSRAPSPISEYQDSIEDDAPLPHASFDDPPSWTHELDGRMQSPQPDNLNIPACTFTEPYGGCSKVFPGGKSFMDSFREDRYAEER
jgi:hypothetical protein